MRLYGLLGGLACAVAGTRAAVEADPDMKSIPVSQSWDIASRALECSGSLRLRVQKLMIAQLRTHSLAPVSLSTHLR